MVALKGKAIEEFVARRNPSYGAVLIYGPDAGLVRERSQIIAKKIVPDLNDPFNAIELSDNDIKDDPARLVDEISALSFAGGERVVRMRGAGEAVAKPAKTLIEGLDAGHVKPNGLVIIEAGDLSPRSGLRKLFEGAKAAVALPCYADKQGDIRKFARSLAGEAGLSFEDEALDVLCANLGEDHGVTRSEVEKLLHYMGGWRDDAQSGAPRRISAEDVEKTIVDGLGRAADDTARAAADGDAKRVATTLYKATASGAAPITILRACQRTISRLQTAHSHMDSGASSQDAMKKLRPPVFFAEQGAFQRQLDRWGTTRLDQAMRMLIETELAAKSSNAPQRNLVERAALRLAMMARR